MLIRNHSSVAIQILDCVLEPNEFENFSEQEFKTIEIRSQLGSCYITTQYSKRHILNLGKIIATENQKKEIIIS